MEGEWWSGDRRHGDRETEAEGHAKTPRREEDTKGQWRGQSVAMCKRVRDMAPAVAQALSAAPIHAVARAGFSLSRRISVSRSPV